MELGSGAGLVGIILARLGARSLLTDGCEAAMRNCEHNLRINGIDTALMSELDANDAWPQVNNTNINFKRLVASFRGKPWELAKNF